MANSVARMRLGLLVCDHVLPALRDVAGDYPDFFNRLFLEQPEIEIVEFDLTAGEFPSDLDQCDAWITTGSRLSVYEDVPWVAKFGELVRCLDRDRRKLVGVCFGAQMIAHALGGEVARAPWGWQVGLKHVTIRALKPWMVPAVERFGILHSNDDQVLVPPDRARVLGSGESGPVSLFSVDEHFIGFQGHPEFVPAYSAALMEARRGTLIPSEVVDAALSTLETAPDTPLLSAWIANFIRGAGALGSPE